VHVRIGGNDVLRVTAVAVPAGVDRVRAEVFAAAAAVPARTVRSRQPRHSDPVTPGEPRSPMTGLDDLADDLVPWRHVRAPWRQVTLGQVQVSTAHATAQHPDQQLARARLGNRPVQEDERPCRHRTWLMHDPCPHQTRIDVSHLDGCTSK
jgi:hypothetical protein